LFSILNFVGNTRIIGVELVTLGLQTLDKLLVVQQCSHHCTIDSVETLNDQHLLVCLVGRDLWGIDIWCNGH
jgi:hypothetical protein